MTIETILNNALKHLPELSLCFLLLFAWLRFGIMMLKEG
jgi:hypothetical protein